MKSLFNHCISYVSNNLGLLIPWTSSLPVDCREQLLEWLVSHDRLCIGDARALLTDNAFTQNMTSVSFYLSDELTDELLALLAQNNKQLTTISLIYCSKITNDGITALTKDQSQLSRLELRGLRQLTREGIAAVTSDRLTHVDLSECTQIDSLSIQQLLQRNPSVRHLSLNNCHSIDDTTLGAIASIVGSRLHALELDFLANLDHPMEAIMNLTQKCTNLRSLSLCRYFQRDVGMFDTAATEMLKDMECHLESRRLTDLDLYANFFSVLPSLPASITSLRLSCAGDENVDDIADRLLALPKLASISLVVSNHGSGDDGEPPISINNFLRRLLPRVGDMVTVLQVHCKYLSSAALRCIDEYCVSLRVLCLDTENINSVILSKFFTGNRQRAKLMTSVRLSGIRISSRTLHMIARLCISLRELDLAHIINVDDRTLKSIAVHCPHLRCINVNGCAYIGDIGMSTLARHCHRLQEVRMRGTRCTDRSLYTLAECCPQLQWISHEDYSRQPNFSKEALQNLRDTCHSRVIC